MTKTPHRWVTMGVSGCGKSDIVDDKVQITVVGDVCPFINFLPCWWVEAYEVPIQLCLRVPFKAIALNDRDLVSKSSDNLENGGIVTVGHQFDDFDSSSGLTIGEVAKKTMPEASRVWRRRPANADG